MNSEQKLKHLAGYMIAYIDHLCTQADIEFELRHIWLPLGILPLESALPFPTFDEYLNLIT